MIAILGVVIAGMALLITVIGGFLGYLIKQQVGVAALTEQLKAMVGRIERVGDDIEKLVRDKDKAHSEILAQMRNDRETNHERLTWLERNRRG